MKILGMQASRGENGLTATMAKAALAGAEAAGAETELLHLRKLKLGACLACEDDGWGRCRKESLCIIEDDIEMVRDKMAAADGIVISTPVYWGNIAEVLKNFLDRLRRCELAGPEDQRVEGKLTLAIAAAGGSGGGGPICLVSMEQYFIPLNMPVFDYLIVTRRSMNYMLPAARAAGEWMVEYMREQRA